MLKICGILLIIGSFTGIGISQRQQFRTRVVALGDMISVLDYITGELSYHLTGLPEMIHNLAEDERTAVYTIFQPMHKYLSNDDGLSLTYKWMKSFRENGKQAGLHEDDIAILCDLCEFIGKYDAQAQQQSLAYARKRLTQQLDTATGELKSKGMVYRSCCIAAGILLVLVLL